LIDPLSKFFNFGKKFISLRVNLPPYSKKESAKKVFLVSSFLENYLSSILTGAKEAEKRIVTRSIIYLIISRGCLLAFISTTSDA
jgi:hypothetical protein